MVVPLRKRAKLRHRHQLIWGVAAGMLIVLGLWLGLRGVQEPEEDEFIEDDEGMLLFIQNISYPDWFTSSFLNLPEDLNTALAEGKRGLVLYFARDECPCCEVMKEINLEDPINVTYMQKYFNFIAIDVWGHMEVTDFNGETHTEARFAKLKNAAATPSMLFFNAQGQEIFRLRGYHEPYTFRAVLDYVLGHKENETFDQYWSYLFRPELFDYFELHENKLFHPPPYHLDRSKMPSERPLVVFFERGDCPGCDLLHAELMQQFDVVKPLEKMDVVQLDITSDTPVVTPAGYQTTSREWAIQLGIFYTPTVIFFDHHGNPVTRVDSITALRNLGKTLKQLELRFAQVEDLQTGGQ